MEAIAGNFNQNPTDTRQYKMNAACCRYLSSRGSLSPYHRGCCHAGRCVAPDKYVVRKVMAAHGG